jgi:hydrogenase expression/formation protein HypD
MKYMDEYRKADVAHSLATAITHAATKKWVLMEICGGQTHSIVRHGIDRMLPPNVELVHGPGCPVCVTSLEVIDKAHAIAAQPNVIFTSFGDMLRVPGSRGDLLGLRSRGADVRVVYAPLDAVILARKNPEKRVVFFGIGFETTAPANAMAVHYAKKHDVRNFSMLVSHVLVPPALAAILASPDNRVQGFLGPGHVCAVMGTNEYEELAKEHNIPIVISGFEPIDLLDGILRCVRQLESGKAEVENQYARTVATAGNRAAQALVKEVFTVTDRKWRGIGMIPKSGYRIAEEYADYDAERHFDVAAIKTCESEICISGEILRGLKKPGDCRAFGRSCTPQSPLGATMVSAEGACAAYFQYGRHQVEEGANGLD